MPINVPHFHVQLKKVKRSTNTRFTDLIGSLQKGKVVTVELSVPFRSSTNQTHLARQHSDQRRQDRYAISRTAAAMCRAEIPNASTNSSGFPECGIPVTAKSLNFVGATPACASAVSTASPSPPSGQ